MLTNLQTRDVETLIHPYTNLDAHRTIGPLVLEQAKGIYVYDTDGKPYIEGMAGLWCASLGYGNEELVEAAASQMRRLSFTHLFSGRSHDPAIELAEKLKEMAPMPVSKVVDSTGAGDQYAAGFLFAHAKQRSIAECGALASLAASEVISHMGPRPETNLRTLALKSGFRV